MPKFIWLGTSVEDDAHGRERIADLVETPAAVRFLSMEPLLGPVDYLRQYLNRLHWIIVGGESGQRARPMHPDWLRAIRDVCAEMGVPFFFKQWGEFHPADQVPPPGAAHGPMGNALRTGRAHAFEDQWSWKIGKKLAGRLLDGVEHNAMPEVCNV
ncbi:MAG TPA: DUF5131 family protein [Sphingobium sp.]